MKELNWEPVHSYWVVVFAGVKTFVDHEEARSLIDQIKKQNPILEFKDIFDSSNVIPLKVLEGMWDTSDEIGDRWNKQRDMLKEKKRWGDDD